MRFIGLVDEVAIYSLLSAAELVTIGRIHDSGVPNENIVPTEALNGRIDPEPGKFERSC